MPTVVTVLYEDQRGPGHGFGLHALVKACVFDAIDGERHRVEKMLDDHRPLKGVQSLLRACREDIDLIAADGRSVVAVIDDDAIRRQLGLPATARDADVERAIRKGCRAPDQLRIVLLKKNNESVLEAAAVCDPSLDSRRVDRAIKHKDLLERDAILMELSRERSLLARDCILGRVPSLKALVDLLGELVTARPATEGGHRAAKSGARGRKKPSR